MSAIIPLVILLFLLWAMHRRVDAYDAFTRGAAEALPLLGKVLPFMAAMMIAMSAFRACGALDFIKDILAPLTTRIGMPADLLPLFLLRPFSGNAAMALLQDLFIECGVDSLEGYAASVMLGSTETIFYCMAIYLGALGIKRMRHALPAALAASLVGTAAALILANWQFS